MWRSCSVYIVVGRIIRGSEKFVRTVLTTTGCQFIEVNGAKEVLVFSTSEGDKESLQWNQYKYCVQNGELWEQSQSNECSSLRVYLRACCCIAVSPVWSRFRSATSSANQQQQQQHWWSWRSRRTPHFFVKTRKCINRSNLIYCIQLQRWSIWIYVCLC